MRSPHDRSIAAVVLLVASVAATPAPARAATEEAVQAVSAELLCYCGCARRNIAECTCGTAASEREAIAGMLDQGMSAEAIVDSYVDRYGQQILIVPPTSGFPLVAWLLPVVAVAALAAIFAFVVRRWKESTPEPHPVSAGVDDAEQERLRQRLREELEQIQR